MRREPLRNLHLGVEGGGSLAEVSPAMLPALYPGGQLAILGRYRGQGSGILHLRGTRAGQEVDLKAQVGLSETDTANSEIRRMWAERRVHDILQEIRSAARPEADRDEVIRLGTQYSIVTPYTSFLVLESDQMFRQYGIERRTASLLDEEAAGRAQRTERSDDKFSAIPAGESPKPIEWNVGLGAGASGPEFLGILSALLAGRAILRRRIG
jgi:Ca-activated chloride channel family protein